LYGEDQQLDAGWSAEGRFCVRIALPLRGMEAAA
jgi:two-component system sensor histidine kinase AlgZ